MPRTKIVNGIRYDFTPEEEAQYEADAEAFDLDLHAIRSERNTRLRVSDWTRLDDATLGDHTAEEWADYRALLRALPQTYNRVSEVVWLKIRRLPRSPAREPQEMRLNSHLWTAEELTKKPRPLMILLMTQPNS